MNNELQIKPLLAYDVTYRNPFNGELLMDTFTADEIEYTNEGITGFYRTGNLIRLYFNRLEKIVITPVDAEEIPA